MGKFKHILIASHGSIGARAAEKTALSLCTRQTTLHHLIVVPDFWKGMMGDDWLNNASTRDRFGKYIESQLGQEVSAHIAKLRRAAERRKVRYRVEVVVGKPADCLIAQSQRDPVNLIVMGSPRPKGIGGFRSRMLTEQVLKSVTTPVLIVPFPHG